MGRTWALLALLAAAQAEAQTVRLQSADGASATVELPARGGAGAPVSLCLSVPRSASGAKGLDLGGRSRRIEAAPGQSACRSVAPAPQTLRLWSRGRPAMRGGVDLSGRGGGTAWVRWWGD